MFWEHKGLKVERWQPATAFSWRVGVTWNHLISVDTCHKAFRSNLKTVLFTTWKIGQGPSNQVIKHTSVWEQLPLCSQSSTTIKCDSYVTWLKHHQHTNQSTVLDWKKRIYIYIMFVERAVDVTKFWTVGSQNPSMFSMCYYNHLLMPKTIPHLHHLLLLLTILLSSD